MKGGNATVTVMMNGGGVLKGRLEELYLVSSEFPTLRACSRLLKRSGCAMDYISGKRRCPTPVRSAGTPFCKVLYLRRVLHVRRSDSIEHDCSQNPRS